MLDLSHVFHLIGQKYEYALKRDATWATHVPYVTSMKHDLNSLDDDIVANNAPMLEDKLGNILRDFCNMLYTLEKEGYIDTKVHVFEKCLEKYEERVSGEVEERIAAKEGLQRDRLFHQESVE